MKKYPNSGILNENHRKTSEKSPDWYGRIEISGDVLEALKQGKPIRLSGWNRSGQYGDFISLSAQVERPKENEKATDDYGGWDYKTAQENASLNQATSKKVEHVDDFNDDIPF